VGVQVFACEGEREKETKTRTRIAPNFGCVKQFHEKQNTKSKLVLRTRR